MREDGPKAKWPFQNTFRVQLRRFDGTFGSYVVEAGSHAHAIVMVRQEEPDAQSVVAVKKEV